VDSEDLKDLSVKDIVCYKYARLVSCDVELYFLNTNHSSLIPNTQYRTCTLQFSFDCDKFNIRSGLPDNGSVKLCSYVCMYACMYVCK
jgi:hypothetical protein